MKKAGNKRLLLNAKFQQLFTKKDFFFFLIFLRFYTTNLKEFRSSTSYLCSKCTAKTYKMKDFSLDNDVKTHSSIKEENEKGFFIYLSASKATKGKYLQAQNQENKFWLKAQIEKNQSKDTQWQ
jgi:hypothetical protein